MRACARATEKERSTRATEEREGGREGGREEGREGINDMSWRD